jgi:hypothetical protein
VPAPGVYTYGAPHARSPSGGAERMSAPKLRSNRRKSMKRILLAAVAIAFAAPALANNCPNEIKAIDAALQTAKVDASKKAQAQKLRNDADAAHKAGNHAASMKASGEAKAILGIK